MISLNCTKTELIYFCKQRSANPTTVHPRLSEQAELNLGKVRSDKPKIWIIEDGILSLIVSPSSILIPKPMSISSAR